MQLSNGLQIAHGLLGRCPSCMTSFTQHICDMTCGVHHSKFIDVIETKINPENNRSYVSAVDFHISKEYTQGTYSSCRNVIVPATGQKALDLMCGSWTSSKCTDERWFEFMGDKDTPNVPFPINYKFHNSSDVDKFTPFNGRFVPCNESADVSIYLLSVPLHEDQKRNVATWTNCPFSGIEASVLVCGLCDILSKATATWACAAWVHHLGHWWLLRHDVHHLSAGQFNVHLGNRLL